MNELFTILQKIDFVFALLASFVLYFVFNKKDELGKNAAQNTAATIVVLMLNGVMINFVFVGDFVDGARLFYTALGVPSLNPEIWSGLPIWMACIIAIAAVDFADYCSHRLMHTRWLWPTHAAHHSDTHVNAFTTYRIHFLEYVVMSLSHIFLLTWLQLPGLIPAVVLIRTLHNAYIHIDLKFEHGWLRYFIASPVFHRWHHADVPEAYGKNLANTMPIYDLIFGTYYYPGPCNEEMGALKTGVEDKNPFMIMIYPFQEWGRLIREAFRNVTVKDKGDHVFEPNSVKNSADSS